MAVDNFGGLTDHFGLASTDLILIDSSLVPVSKSVERVEDENGDYADEENHGQNAAGDLSDASCTYELQSGTLNINTLAIGESASGTIAASMDISTDNKDWPKFVVAGQINTEAVTAPTAKTNIWTIADSITLVGAKRAQLFDFTVDVGSKMTGTSYSANVEIAQTTNGVGVVTAHGVSGGVVTQGVDLVRITAACAWTPGAGWEETQVPGAEEPQAGFHTGSGSAEKILVRGVVT